MHQVPGGQAAHVLRSVLNDGMDADSKAVGLEHGENGKVDAFEGARYGFATALLGVCVLMMAEEA